MKGLALFAAGILVGVAATHTATAQDSAPRALSHVGIAVKDFDAAMAYYTKTVGLREAYSLKQPDGRPLLTYLHVSRDTFLELQPATATVPPGLTHFAVEFGGGAHAAAGRHDGRSRAHAGPGALHPPARSRRRVDRGDGVRP